MNAIEEQNQRLYELLEGPDYSGLASALEQIRGLSAALRPHGLTVSLSIVTGREHACSLCGDIRRFQDDECSTCLAREIISRETLR